jgi:hypothetical protein
MLFALGLLLLPMVQMTSVVSRNPMTSARTRVAVDMAQDAIDRFRKTPWDSIRSSPAEGFAASEGGVGPAYSNLPGAAGDSVAVQGTMYYRLWRVAPDERLPNLKTVTVWCCWRDGDGAWRDAVLVTQLADVGYPKDE